MRTRVELLQAGTYLLRLPHRSQTPRHQTSDTRHQHARPPVRQPASQPGQPSLARAGATTQHGETMGSEDIQVRSSSRGHLGSWAGLRPVPIVHDSAHEHFVFARSCAAENVLQSTGLSRPYAMDTCRRGHLRLESSGQRLAFVSERRAHWLPSTGHPEIALQRPPPSRPGPGPGSNPGSLLVVGPAALVPARGSSSSSSSSPSSPPLGLWAKQGLRSQPCSAVAAGRALLTKTPPGAQLQSTSRPLRGLGSPSQQGMRRQPHRLSSQQPRSRPLKKQPLLDWLNPAKPNSTVVTVSCSLGDK
ncbi:hypothetical protein DHEL01_v205186 [Diaporthe helianthi]|uniref:Uncharacterized protein n=1 Tax=Diaporthe helianthi TaxID=158607 RepID=A0A2P5I1S7_DIAHE|nr:hypothetical protein DHEL01_v205186 [Diaporthe helianthi]